MSKLFDDASLAMIPSAYKDGKLYSIRPTDGSGDFTFSRGSNLAATRVDVNGLIEKGRENRFYPSDFSSGLSQTRCSITPNAADPYGGTEAVQFITSLDASTTHYILKNVVIAAIGQVMTMSVTAKANGYDFFRIEQGNNSKGATFNLLDGTIDNDNGIAASIESVGNGWYKCSVAVLTISTGFAWVAFFMPTSSVSYTGDGVSGGFLYGAQLEAGLVATDYIETGASTAQAGILEDMPRLDYSGGASCPALLLEPQRTNSISQSEYFEGDGWIATNVTSITSNYGISPQGKRNSTRIVGSSQSILYYSLSSPFNGTRSIYVKATSGSGSIQLLSHNSNTDNVFEINTDWQRVDVTNVQSTIGLENLYAFDMRGASTDIYDIEIWGCQYEAGSYPTSYIPTYGSSVTRSLDVCDLDGMNASGISTSNNWTYFIDVDDFEAGSNGFYLYSTSGEILHLFSTSVGYRNTSNSATYVNSWSWSPYNGNNSQVKMIFRYDGDKLVVFLNGVKKDEVDSSLVSSRFNDPFNRDRFHWAGLSKWDTNQKAFYDTALTDSECIALTTI